MLLLLAVVGTVDAVVGGKSNNARSNALNVVAQTGSTTTKQTALLAACDKFLRARSHTPLRFEGRGEIVLGEDHILWNSAYTIRSISNRAKLRG